MTFSSLVFIFIFLPVTFLLYILCGKTGIRSFLLVASSLFFYAYGEPIAVLLMIFSIVLNYALGILCSKDDSGKSGLWLAVVFNIGLLFIFKYLVFFVGLLNRVAGLTIPVPDISLPIGISFFTFQGLSYVIDVYRDKSMVQKNILHIFLYISFFPQLIAGPIVKYHDISLQLDNRALDADRISRGICRFITGLGKKVIIANQVGYMADLVFASPASGLSTLSAWIGALCYLLQIFFDFSGYSDMAIGLGCIFGFDFKENFNYPYIADSMREFWHRWHISLSTWFLEYVYIPLGGNRHGAVAAYRNKFIVFLLTGLWHGANLTFIVWGLIHGFFLTLENIIPFPTHSRWLSPLRHLYVLLVATVTFVIFRADTITGAFTIIGKMFINTSGIYTVNAPIYSGITLFRLFAFTLGVIFALPVIPWLKNQLGNGTGATVGKAIEYIISIIVFLMSVLLLVSSEYNPFIYFRF